MKVRLGDYIQQSDLRNAGNKIGVDFVVGLSTQKQIIKTVADMDGVPLHSYKLLPPMYFGYVPDTSRRGDKMSLGFNTTEKTFLISSIYIVFYVSKPEALDSEYLFMYFNRPEFDRYARFNSWGSAREVFSWDDMCDIEIDLPDIETQRKFVAVYKAMTENQKCYENGLEDLKLTCDAYIENNIDKSEYARLGDFIENNNDRNNDEKYGIEDIRGFNEVGNFIMPMRTFSGNIKSFRIIKKDDFVYNPRIPTTKFPIALNNNVPVLTSPAYATFRICKNDLLYKDYLIMILQRSNFSRKVLFHTWGSSTPFLGHDDLCDLLIPLPKIEIQIAISNIYKAYIMRREINEKLKAQIKDMCRILVKGATDK